MWDTHAQGSRRRRKGSCEMREGGDKDEEESNEMAGSVLLSGHEVRRLWVSQNVTDVT